VVAQGGINERIEEKILQSTFKFQNGLCLSYLLDLLSKKVHSSYLRSADGHSLVTPLLKRRAVGGRSFSSVGPRLWNNLRLSFRVGSQIRTNADPGTSFCALARFYLKAACYCGLSSAAPVLQTVALVWNVGYLMRTESQSCYSYTIENSSA